VLYLPTLKSPRSPQRLPNQRWQIYPDNTEWLPIWLKLQLSPIVSQLLINRGIKTWNKHKHFRSRVPGFAFTLEEFPDLAISLELLQAAIATGKIAICGDYDADGMILPYCCDRFGGWRLCCHSQPHAGRLRHKCTVEEFHQEGVQLILTVDNGISAFEPIARARAGFKGNRHRSPRPSTTATSS